MKSKIVPSEILWGKSKKLHEIVQVYLVILEGTVHPRIKNECIPLISGAFYFSTSISMDKRTTGKKNSLCFPFWDELSL